MATLSVTPERQASEAIESTIEISKRHRLAHFMRGKLLRLVSGGDSPSVSTPHETVSLPNSQLPVAETSNPQLVLRVPKAKDSSFTSITYSVGAGPVVSQRMPTISDSLIQNPKIRGETRSDYIKRITGPQPVDALEGPIYVPTNEPTPQGDAAHYDTYVPKHRAAVPPDAVVSQKLVDSHIYNNLQAESRPQLHIAK